MLNSLKCARRLTFLTKFQYGGEIAQLKSVGNGLVMMLNKGDERATRLKSYKLQIAFSKGLLKPGLNYAAPAPKQHINNETGLKECLSNFKKDLPWIERMDLTVDPLRAPKPMLEQLGPDPDNLTGDSVHDDFKREMKFYRQAQSAVLEGIPRLHKLGVNTRRPEDYFAEMAKSDDHMKRVKEKLISKQLAIERSEKAKKMRELRKYGKKVQVEVLQKRQKEKKEMLNAVKKYRKGKTDRLDFLDDEKASNQKGRGGGGKMQPGNKGSQPGKKRTQKNEKFGYGGQKKRSKHNTAKSARDMSEFSIKKHGAKSGNPKAGKVPSKMMNKNKRPGKTRRQSKKNK